jgi:hypothetical protein
MSDHADHVQEPEPTSIADAGHGTWIRAQVGPKTYLGHVHQLDFEDPYVLKDVTSADGEPPKDHKKQACSARAVLEAKVITLMPAYELSVSVTRVPVAGPDGKPVIDPETHMPQYGMSREPIVAGIDFCLHPVPLHIKAAETAIYVFSQAHRNDQGTLRDFCRHAEARNKKFREEALSQSTGLVSSASPEQARAEAERQRRVRHG